MEKSLENNEKYYEFLYLIKHTVIFLRFQTSFLSLLLFYCYLCTINV